MAYPVGRTKLQKSYYLTRLVSMLSNYMFAISLVCLILPFAIILVPLLAVIYFVYALVLSFVLIICTLGLILLTVNDDEGILQTLWGRLNDGFFDELGNQILTFSSVFVPVVGGLCIVSSIVLMVLVSKGLGRANKHKDRTLLVLSMIFCTLGIFFALLFKYGVK